MVSSIEGEVTYALDNFCDSAGAVVVGPRKFIHTRWVHPHSSGHRDRGAGDSVAVRSQTSTLRAVPSALPSRPWGARLNHFLRRKT